MTPGEYEKKIKKIRFITQTAKPFTADRRWVPDGFADITRTTGKSLYATGYRTNISVLPTIRPLLFIEKTTREIKKKKKPASPSRQYWSGGYGGAGVIDRRRDCRNVGGKFRLAADGAEK